MDIEKRAREIAVMHAAELDPKSMSPLYQDILSLVREAVEEVKPPTGHVLTDDGVVRKVLGTLPMTADGFVVGLGATIYNARMTGIDGKAGTPFTVNDHTLWGPSDPGNGPVEGAVMWPQAGRPDAWFATREAAIAASTVAGIVIAEKAEPTEGT